MSFLEISLKTAPLIVIAPWEFLATQIEFENFSKRRHKHLSRTRAKAFITNYIVLMCPTFREDLFWIIIHPTISADAQRCCEENYLMTSSHFHSMTFLISIFSYRFVPQRCH